MYSPSSLVLSNFLWFIFGGFIIFIEYLLVGFVFILTVFLFRSGVQIWKLALLVVAPLNRNWSSIVDKSPSGPFPNGFMWTCRLIIWIPFMVLIFMTHVAFMIVLTISIVGVPLAHLHWRMCTLILYPVVIDDLGNRVAHFRSVANT